MGDAPTIPAGIDAAADGDEVVLADGVFLGVPNRNLELRGKRIVVRSESGNPEASLIDCENEDRAFFIHSDETAATVISGIGMVNGSGDTSGGIFVHGASPTITGCVVSGATSFGAFGSGIALHQSDSVVGDCIVQWTGGGGYSFGIFAYFFSDVIVRNCTIVATEGFSVGAGAYTHVDLERTIVALNDGAAVACLTAVAIQVECCDLYGNFSLDPIFCDLLPGDFTLRSCSP